MIPVEKESNHDMIYIHVTFHHIYKIVGTIVLLIPGIQRFLPIVCAKMAL